GKGLSAKFNLKTGQAVAFSLSFSAEGPAVVPPLGDLVSEKLDLTIDWWRNWAAKSNYRGPYERQVSRSALVLKLLSYAPSGAIEQVQLDIYGEVVEAVSHFSDEIEKLDRDMQKMLHQCAEYVCEHWREPDNGMWEERGERRHYTHSRLMCWVALDRLLKMQR